MAALAAAKVRTVQKPNLVVRRSVVVDTGETLYSGAIVTLNGVNGAEAATTGNACIGISTDTYTAGQTAILEYNHIELLTLASPTVANIGAAVYASDSGTLTLTPNTAIVGYISDLGSVANTVYVRVTTRV